MDQCKSSLLNLLNIREGMIKNLFHLCCIFSVLTDIINIYRNKLVNITDITTVASKKLLAVSIFISS